MRYGRFLCLGLVAVLVGTILAAPAGAQLWPMRPVPDPEGRFTIDLPVGWQVKSLKSGQPAMIAIAPNAVEDGFPNVNVVADVLTSPLSSEEFARRSESFLRTVFHEFTVVQQGPTQIGGHAAYYRYYTWRTNVGTTLFQLQAYMALGTRGFVVTGTTRNDPERIRIDIPVLSQIIGTFRPSPPPQ